MKKSNRLLVTLVCAAMLFMMSVAPASAEEGSYIPLRQDEDYVRDGQLVETHTEDGRLYLSAATVSPKTAWTYKSVSIYHGGKRLGADARLIGGVTYVSVRAFINEISSYKVNYNSKTRTLNIRGNGFEMDIIDGSCVVYVNGRVIYLPTPCTIMSNGSMYAPVSSLARALSLTFSEDTASRSATLTGSVRPITHGSIYYDADAVYWLSRIISAESKGEPLLGQIAVGCVVLNRVKSPSYPNTIWGVIFDRKYGVQFSPILNGTIYNTPSAASITAAKICLESYVVSPNALFFLHPRLATSSWIPKNRDYLFTIANHDFYA